MRIHILVNPMAGRGRAPQRVAALERMLVSRGAEVTVRRTTGPGDAARHVGTLAPGDLDRLVVVGGDGTLHEAVNGRERLPWPVAMVPLGTANLVARDAVLPLGADVEPPVRTILEGGPWEVDLLQTDRGRALSVDGPRLDAALLLALPPTPC